MNEESEAWQQYREEQKERRKERLPVRTEEIHKLEQHGYKVEKKSDYQYRINDKLDLYPIHNRFHLIQKNKRGSYNPLELLKFIKSKL